MQKPNESLHDHVVKGARETTPEPSRGGSLELADDPRALEDRDVSEPVGSTFLLWAHRFVAVGSILATIAFILLCALSAFLIVIGEPATQPSATTNGQPAEEPEATTDVEHADESETTTNGEYAYETELLANEQPPNEQSQTRESVSIFSASSSTRVSITRANRRPRRTRPRIRVAGYETKRSPRWRARPLEPLFIPTTLVIYVDDGVIKTRIEPWLRSPPTPNN